MKQELFRKEAMDRLSSPEALDALLMVTRPRQWLALCGLFVLIIISIVWAFTGEIVVRESVNAALVSSGGLDSIIVKEGGEIRDIRIKAGDYVKRGEVIARLNREDLVRRILDFEDTYGSHLSLAQKTEIDILKDELEQSSVVVAKNSGRVVRVNASVGDIIPSGFSLIEISVMGDQVKDLVGVMYAPLSMGRLIRPGMSVYIYPSMVKKEEFGYMYGRVNEISKFTVDHSEINKMIGSDALISNLTQDQAVLQVLVDLQLNPDTVSGYEWSSSEGPNLQLESETLCSADIILGTRKPIELIFPTISSLL